MANDGANMESSKVINKIMEVFLSVCEKFAVSFRICINKTNVDSLVKSLILHFS